jgi:hypothetical protein
MSVKTEASVMIDCAPEAVFAVITDVVHHHEWSKGAGKVQDLTDTPAKMGTTWTQVTKLMGRDIEGHGKVHVYVPNRQFGTQVDKPFPGKMRWLVEPDGTGSKVTLSMEIEPGGFFGTVTAPILAKSIRDNFTADLARLKVYAEKKA